MPERSLWTTRERLVALGGAQRPFRELERASRLDADLDVAEAGGRGAVRDVRVLAGLALAAVRQPVQPPLVGAGDARRASPRRPACCPV